jgi:predicted transcriptional regulator of viral defense system
MSAQALARLAELGHLERLRHGVYRITGTPPGQWSNLQAAWLALQPDLGVAERLSLPGVEVVSHRSAAQIHRIGDLDADRLEFLTPERRQTRDRDVRLRRGVVAPADRTVVEGLPVTTPLRTIVDLAAARLDGDHLAGVVRDAVTTLHLDPDLVAQALRPYAHRYGAPLGDGRGLLTDLLQRVGVPQATRTAAELWSAPLAQRAIDDLLPTTRVNPLPQQVQAALDEAMRPFTAQLAALAETLRPFTAAHQAALAEAMRPDVTASVRVPRVIEASPPDVEAGETDTPLRPSDQKKSDRKRRPGAGGHASQSAGRNRGVGA